MRYIILGLAVLGASCGQAQPDAYNMAPGERLTVQRFTAVDGSRVDFTVAGAIGQPVAVGVAFDGTPDGVHTSYGFLGAKQADPYTDATPRPLLAGDYSLILGCGDEATSRCVFSFYSEVTP